MYYTIPMDFDFALPTEFQYTDEHPYISQGKGRNYPKGKAYTKVDGDVAEFEDLFLGYDNAIGVNKMGLGIDEYIEAGLQLSRKNYCDMLDDGTVKLVGNSIKSKKMPIYIEKFLDKAIPMLLNNDDGTEFLNYYYDYIEKIYNYKIPLKDIASVSKIKISINDYKRKCKEVTKAGTKKSRQAWYELAIRDNINVNMGDSIYYINTGNKKSVSDIKRVTHFYSMDIYGEKVDMTKEVTKEYNTVKKETKPNGPNFKETGRKYPGKEVDWTPDGKGKYSCMKLSTYVSKYYSEYVEEDEIIFNCIALPNNIVNSENDVYCDENTEYNVEKYIEAFNSRIKPLLICFDKQVREHVTYNAKGEKKVVNDILITNPKDRKTFTVEETKLISGQPFEEGDVDSIERLLQMEDREIGFWLSVGMEPPYWKECGMDWDEMKKGYYERQEKMKSDEIQVELKRFNEIVEKMTLKDRNDFFETGVINSDIYKFCDFDSSTMEFVSKKYGVVLGSLYDIIDGDGCEVENDEYYGNNNGKLKTYNSDDEECDDSNDDEDD